MLIKVFSIFIISIVSCSQNSWALDACSNVSSKDKRTKEVDLRSEMGPIRDQDSIGWCYGFTGADLLTHYLYKTNASEVQSPDKNVDYRDRKYAVSAVGMSTFFNRSKNADFFKNVSPVKNADDLLKKYNKNVVPEGGTIEDALIAAKKNGFCFEKDLSSENFGYVQDNRCGIHGKCNLEEMLKIVFDLSSNNRQCQNTGIATKMFPTLSEKTIKSVLAASQRQYALSNLATVVCNKKFAKRFFWPDRPVIKSKILNDPNSSKFQPKYSSRTREELIDNVDEVLNNGTPVGVMFYANFLLSSNAKETGPHAVSVVGKRFNPKTCEVEYILRNSWGASCDMYDTENPQYGPCTLKTKNDVDPKIIYAKMRLCRDEFPPVHRNPRVNCESGYAYVRKSDLTKFIFGTTYLEE